NWAPTNYLGNQGIVCDCRGKSCAGMFGHGTYFRMANITDGASRTIAIGETLKGDLDPLTIEDNYIFSTSGSADNIDACQSFASNTSDRATVWIGGQPHNNMFSTARSPNDPRVDCKAPSQGCTNFATRSMHPNGATVGFADGSAHFLQNDINAAVMQALGTRAAQDIPGEF